MISCLDFIPAYSELFTFLEEKGGKQAVIEFWNYLGDNFLGNLRALIQQYGLRGCWLYWGHTLNEEAADFTMELDEESGRFQILMHRCPSMSRLTEMVHIVPYRDYCEHCNVLYRRVLEPLGYSYDIDLSQCKEARCTVRIVRPRQPICRPDASNGPDDYGTARESK